MKETPNTPASVEEEQTGMDTTIRFWVCFVVCGAILGLISGFMLFGLFLVMGYRIF